MEMIMCWNRLHNSMEKPSGSTSIILSIALTFGMLVPLFSIGTAAADTTGPQITDLTSGNPATGDIFTIRASVTDESTIASVRLYQLYFKVPEGITQPTTIDMALLGSQYQADIQIPQNASKLTYTILAKDSLSFSTITDYIHWNVHDNEEPSASCETIIYLNMGGIHIFNGSASSDNVGIANYSWTLTLNGSSSTLYGPNPAFKFAIPGDYTGRLTVKDTWGNFDFANFAVKVNDTEPPVADAGIGMYVLQGNYTSFDGLVSSDNIGIVNYTWQFTYNGSVVKLYGPSPLYKFWTPGVYQVNLTVRDAAGYTDTSSTSVEVLTPSEEETESNWWVYVLVIMIVIIVILGLVIVRT